MKKIKLNVIKMLIHVINIIIYRINNFKMPVKNRLRYDNKLILY